MPPYLPRRTSRWLRSLVALALIGAVVLMGTARIFPDGNAAASPMPGMMAQTSPTQPSGPPHEASVGCTGDCAPGALHACLAVLVLATVLFLVAASRIRNHGNDDARSRPAPTWSRGRSPPVWTVLTLSQLSVIRV